MSKILSLELTFYEVYMVRKNEELDTLKEIADYVYEKDIEEIERYITCLDNMEDYLDDEDETAGLPDGVFEACEKLKWYFTELHQLRTRLHK